jgi:hypothetical protein
MISYTIPTRGDGARNAADNEGKKENRINGLLEPARRLELRTY